MVFIRSSKKVKAFQEICVGACGFSWPTKNLAKQIGRGFLLSGSPSHAFLRGFNRLASRTCHWTGPGAFQPGWKNPRHGGAWSSPSQMCIAWSTAPDEAGCKPCWIRLVIFFCWKIMQKTPDKNYDSNSNLTVFLSYFMFGSWRLLLTWTWGIGEELWVKQFLHKILSLTFSCVFPLNS